MVKIVCSSFSFPSGNPDGKQSLEVSIGLPTFLLDENNHNLILIVYLIGLVVIIPSLVGLWYTPKLVSMGCSVHALHGFRYRYSRQYGENNVMYETYQYFDKFTHLNSDLKFLPEVDSLYRGDPFFNASFRLSHSLASFKRSTS